MSEGKVGAPTDEYLVIEQARWLGVAPWDFVGAPETAGDRCWQQWVAEVRSATYQADLQRQRLSANASKHRPR